MTGYLDSLVGRFSGAGNIITPRLSGRFETGFADQLHPLSESMTENEATSISNEINIIPAQENEKLSFPDNKKDPNPQLSKNENDSYSPIEKPNSVTINQLNNEIPAIAHQPEKNTIIKTFIQPSDISTKSGAANNLEIKNDLTNSAKVINGFLDQQVEKETQRNTVERFDGFPVRAEQYTTINNEINHNGFDEPSPVNKTPVIKISIGRIEVRAISTSNVVKEKGSMAQKPRLTLEEYLQKRNKQ